MKKLLLASTALVATAGFAAAEVGLSGSAEIGVKRSNFSDTTEMHHDIGVTFSLSGETPNGIAFGASIGLEEAEGGVATDSEDDYTVFVSAGGATLTMGDTDGAFDKALTEVALGGTIADDHTAHAGYSGNGGSVSVDRASPAQDAIFINSDGDVEVGTPGADDVIIEEAIAAEEGDLGLGMGLDGNLDGQIARFDYTFDAFTGSISAEMDDAGDADPVWAIGGAYNAELAGLALGVGLGYQSQVDFGSVWGLSLSTTFDNGLAAILNYSQFTEDGDALPDHNHFAIGLGYTVGELLLSANYGVYTLQDDFGGADDGDTLAEGWGIAVNYDLGGGLEAQFGYGHSDFNSTIADDVLDVDSTTDSWSLGLAMSF